MPYNLDWLLPGHIIFIRTYDTVTSAELAQTDRLVLDMLEQTGHPEVHILFDSRNLVDMPGLAELLSLRYIAHPYTGCIVSVGADAWIRHQGTLVGKTAGVQFRFADSLEKGIACLVQVDKTLPPLPDLEHHLALLREKFSV